MPDCVSEVITRALPRRARGVLSSHFLEKKVLQSTAMDSVNSIPECLQAPPQPGCAVCLKARKMQKQLKRPEK